MITDKEITDAMKKFDSNRGKVVEFLGISKSTLSRRLKKMKELALKKKSKKKTQKPETLIEVDEKAFLDEFSKNWNIFDTCNNCNISVVDFDDYLIHNREFSKKLSRVKKIFLDSIITKEIKKNNPNPSVARLFESLNKEYIKEEKETSPVHEIFKNTIDLSEFKLKSQEYEN